MILAGAWQFAPLKHACLEKCRHPMPYFLANWSEHRSAVFRMGVTQGLNCLGCCFAMMGLMFIAGAMNIVWMAVLALVMIIEKTASRPKHPGSCRRAASWRESMFCPAWPSTPLDTAIVDRK